jgi:hypothetical protein
MMVISFQQFAWTHHFSVNIRQRALHLGRSQRMTAADELEEKIKILFNQQQKIVLIIVIVYFSSTYLQSFFAVLHCLLKQSARLFCLHFGFLPFFVLTVQQHFGVGLHPGALLSMADGQRMVELGHFGVIHTVIGRAIKLRPQFGSLFELLDGVRVVAKFSDERNT